MYRHLKREQHLNEACMHAVCVEFRDNSFIAAHAKCIELRIGEHANRLRALTKHAGQWSIQIADGETNPMATAILVENETTNTLGNTEMESGLR